MKKSATPLEQLIEAAKSLGEEEILFLLKQARTMIYNKSVDELNEAAEQLEQKRRRTASNRSSPIAVDESMRGSVSIEQSSTGKSYVLVTRNERKLFDPREMMGLVKIAHSTEDAADAIPRLLRWLQRNRDDVILDCGLSARDPAMHELFHLLRDKFTLNE